jgi:hypothetical protein
MESEDKVGWLISVEGSNRFEARQATRFAES